MEHNELMLYARQQVIPARTERAVAMRAKAVYDQTRLAAMQTDAVMALGAHIMENVVALDRRRQMLSGGDPTVYAMLGDIQAATVQNALSLQQRIVGGA